MIQKETPSYVSLNFNLFEVNIRIAQKISVERQTQIILRIPSFFQLTSSQSLGKYIITRNITL